MFAFLMFITYDYLRDRSREGCCSLFKFLQLNLPWIYPLFTQVWRKKNRTFRMIMQAIALNPVHPVYKLLEQNLWVLAMKKRMELGKNRIWNLNYTFSKWKIHNNKYKLIYLKPVSFIMQFIQNNLFKTAYLKQY